VARDVMEAKVSVAAAREEYGVILIEAAHGELEIDSASTMRLRDDLRARRGTPLAVIDRGEGYERMRQDDRGEA